MNVFNFVVFGMCSDKSDVNLLGIEGNDCYQAVRIPLDVEGKSMIANIIDRVEE